MWLVSAWSKPADPEDADMTEAAKEVLVTEEKVTEAERRMETEPAPAQREAWLFENVRRSIEHAFDNLYRGPRRLPFTRSAFDVSPVSPRELIWGPLPTVDIVETENDYFITAELPGVAASDVDVKLSARHLTVKADKKEARKEQAKTVHVSERRYGALERTFHVPESVDTDNIRAAFANGILTIALPKTPEARQSERNIDVATA